MRDYVEQLEHRLLLIARAEQPARARHRPTVRAARTWGLAGAAAAAALVAAVIGLSSGSTTDVASAYPVMSRPSIDVAGRLDGLPQLTRAGADTRNAREVPTAYGRAYVMGTNAGGMCLAWPDPGDGYGMTCGTATQLAARGLPAALVPPGTRNADGGPAAPTAEFIVILPAGAPDPIVHHANGRTETLPIHDGISSTLVRDDVTVSYQVDGRTQTFSVPARAPAMTPTPGAVSVP